MRRHLAVLSADLFGAGERLGAPAPQTAAFLLELAARRPPAGIASEIAS